jgi:dipeptidyl aminopeptidase/acylaminoacyl peptidase
MPFNEHPVHFDVNGQRCHGMLHLPMSGGPHPAVLMLHGFTGQRMEPHRLFVLFSRLLAENGIASLRFDFRGSGESEGTFDEMTVGRELEDVVHAHAFLKARAEIDSSRLGLLGLSMGGMVAALSVANPRLEFGALALWAPAHPSVWLSGIPARGPLDASTVMAIFGEAQRAGLLPPGIAVLEDQGAIDQGGNPVSPEFFADLSRYEPFETVKAHRGPALVVHGTADPTVPFRVGETYARQLESRSPTQFHKVQDGLHTFERLPHQEEAHRVTLEFFKKTLVADGG